MRVALPVLLTVLFFVPHDARADSIWFQFLNSDVDFGPGGAVHYGCDGEVWVAGDVVFFDAGFYTDPLDAADQRLLTAATGTVVQSNYFYPGGTFHFGFEFSQFDSREFALPLASYGLYVPEPPNGQLLEPGPLVDGDLGGDVYFTLGRGVMDAALARRLGIGRRILGGFGGSDMAYSADYCGEPLGNHLSENRHACDGATWITLEVPEPSALALMATWVVAMAVGRRRQRSR